MNGQRPQIAGGGTVNERDPARLRDIKVKPRSPTEKSASPGA
jgi:hypothetical protein